MNPWLLSIFDIFLNYYSQGSIDEKIRNGIIGRTFKHCLIIADEMQNSTPGQMITMLTRLGNDSKLVITGDLNQSDLKNENGLENFVKRVNRFELKEGFMDDIQLIKFGLDDIGKRAIVKRILQIYSNT